MICIHNDGKVVEILRGNPLSWFLSVLNTVQDYNPAEILEMLYFLQGEKSQGFISVCVCLWQ